MDSLRIFVSGSRLSRRPRRAIVKAFASKGLTAVTYEDCPEIVGDYSLTDYLKQSIDLVVFLICEDISDTQNQEILNIEEEYVADRGPAIYLMVSRQKDVSENYRIGLFRDMFTGRYFTYKDDDSITETLDLILQAHEKRRPVAIKDPDGKTLALKDNKAAQTLLGILSDKTQEEAIAAYATSLEQMPGFTGNYTRHKACLEKMRAGDLKGAKDELMSAYIYMKNNERIQALVGALICSVFSGDSINADKCRNAIRDSNFYLSKIEANDGKITKAVSTLLGLAISFATRSPISTAYAYNQGKQSQKELEQKQFESRNLFYAIRAVCLDQS